jgi:hypothetical protein
VPSSRKARPPTIARKTIAMMKTTTIESEMVKKGTGNVKHAAMPISAAALRTETRRQKTTSCRVDRVAPSMVLAARIADVCASVPCKITTRIQNP